jgi:hypothetical protein
MFNICCLPAAIETIKCSFTSISDLICFNISVTIFGLTAIIMMVHDFNNSAFEMVVCTCNELNCSERERSGSLTQIYNINITSTNK